ncbi:hypothetical protein CL654_02850 [bacterium]|nr:hypothetical protein [bacterium]|tara:strand:- start:18788 stop:20311 length:1524 start_codon:yes stop_codon:yes gene_type:complete
MKVFLLSFNNKVQIEAARILKDKGVDIVYWTGARSEFDRVKKERAKFPNTIFHNTYDAARGEAPQDVDTTNFEVPISLIREMHDIESIVLTMMNAIDFTNVPLNKKKHLYYEYVTYWYNVLKQYKPDALLYPDIPHMAHNYVIFALAKRMGIKTIMYTDARRVPDRLLFFEDFHNYKELEESYKEAQKHNVRLGDLAPDIQAFYKNQTDSSKDSTPPMTQKSFFETRKKDTQIIPAFSSLLKNIRKGTVGVITKKYLKNLKDTKQMASLEKLEMSGFAQRRMFQKWEKLRKVFIDEYKSLQKKPDLSLNYVYVPLHVQPERSTSAEGRGIYHDQQLMIKVLSQALPKGWKIYVKEHIPQWLAIRAHLGRYPGYYESIAGLPNVEIIPAESQTFSLIENAKAVATVTGSAAWEALLRGVPALIFGDIFFSLCDGAYKIETEKDAKVALEDIENGKTPDSQKMLQFLYAIQESTVIGHDKHKFNKTREIDDKENASIIASGYYDMLTRT